MNRQAQDVSDQGTALQANRDINIGLGPDELKQIIEALTAQLPAFAAIAREIVDARMKDFEDRILRRFVDESISRAEAFKEPDFQYVVWKAQQAYARSGDEDTLDMLVNLIARRSIETDRNRLMPSLNSAVEKSTTLTHNEFAALSLVYYISHTTNLSIKTFCQMIDDLQHVAAPLITDISEEKTSYTYLQSLGCVSISFGFHKLHGAMVAKYPDVLTRGFELKQLHDLLNPEEQDLANRSDLLIPHASQSGRMRISISHKVQFMRSAEEQGISGNISSKMWELFNECMLTEDEIRENIRPKFPQIDDLFRVWSTTPLQQLDLTSVGMAIAHANLVRLVNVNADLSLWIK